MVLSELSSNTFSAQSATGIGHVHHASRVALPVQSSHWHSLHVVVFCCCVSVVISFPLAEVLLLLFMRALYYIYRHFVNPNITISGLKNFILQK